MDYWMVSNEKRYAPDQVKQESNYDFVRFVFSSKASSLVQIDFQLVNLV